MFNKMLLPCAGLFAFAAIAKAHFQLQFPPPRGPFVMNQEVNFCDGYTDAVSNRSEFPFGQGFITLNSEHPTWSAQVLISMSQNPNNFSAFNTTSNGTQLPPAVPFFKANGEGMACIAIDIQHLNVSGVGDGSNVTIMVRFNGGDGDLFQCADLTLSRNFTIPSSDNCMNLVSNSTSSSSTSTATAANSTKTAGSIQVVPGSNWVLALMLAMATLLL